MHTPNWAKELLHSLPIDVFFAGFKSNTLALAQAGWDLSMEQNAASYSGDYELQLIMRLGDQISALYAVSNRISVRYGDLASGIQSAHSYAQLLASMCFHIQHISPNFQFKVMPMLARSFASNFSPIDAMPQQRETTEDIRDFKFFKMGNADIKDIIVDPKKVPELLDLVLRSQVQTMGEVRGREKSRANFEQYYARPASMVQAQILTLAV